VRRRAADDQRKYRNQGGAATPDVWRNQALSLHRRSTENEPPPPEKPEGR